MTTRDPSESYLHYYAKKVLKEWLINSQGHFFSLKWTGSRIYEEYPLLLSEDKRALNGLYDEVWDEIPSKICDCPIVYENYSLDSSINPCSHRWIRDDHVPTREELLAREWPIAAIIDLVILEGGRIKYMFEVVNTSPINVVKKKLLLEYASRQNAIVYEVDAYYVIRQVCKPSRWRGVKLVADRVVKGNRRRRYRKRK